MSSDEQNRRGPGSFDAPGLPARGSREPAQLQLSLAEFEARYGELLRAHESAAQNEQCVECVGCRACSSCTFCRQSRLLVRCHYCTECEDCSDCSHCRASSGLLSCHHCSDTRDSRASSYLVRCARMSNCTYCFGCVGLSHKDYHILNQPYDRSAYFAISRRLMRELRL